MDGFSVVANVITVLQAANAVISICYDFRAALKTSPWALTRLLDELTDLRNVLESLEGALSSDSSLSSPTPEDSSSQISVTKSVNAPLSNCLAALSHLEGLLEASSLRHRKVSKWQALSQAVGWHFKDSEIEDILERVERYKNTLKLAIAAKEWSVTS